MNRAAAVGFRVVSSRSSPSSSRYSEGEIRFNLMAIVSDRKMIYEKKIAELQTQLTQVSVEGGCRDHAPPGECGNQG